METMVPVLSGTFIGGILVGLVAGTFAALVLLYVVLAKTTS